MISVIVPTHNHRGLLEKKLRALETQQGEFEVVVVADGCSDDTVDFLQTYQPPYPLELIQTPGLGAAGARNRGAEIARGDILLFSDDDVIPQPGWIEAFQQAFARERVVYLGGFRFKEGHVWKPALRFGRLGFNNVNGVALGMTLDIFRKVGGFAEWIKGYGGEDLELGYRLIKAGIPIRYLPQAQAEHLGPTPTCNLTKARQAGVQAVHIVRYHKDPRLALELGVHPALVALKLALLPSFKGLWGPRGDYELAYAWGASEAWNPPSAS